MKMKVLPFLTFLLNFRGALSQSSNIGDFVGQLTSLINQGGALGSVLGAYAGGAGQNGGLSQEEADFGSAGNDGYQRPLGHPGVRPGAPHGGGGYGFPGGRPPPGGLPPPPPPPGAYGGYPPNSLYGALASISQYDDLRCVPRLLCEVAAGARPGSPHPASSSGGVGSIPFLSKDAIITLLTVLNFVDDSPLLVFGRAAVLGYTARGDPRQCLIAYPTCPRDPDKLVDYLNNHNGGFFRFFNQQIPQYAPQYQYYQQHPPAYPPQYPQGPPPPYPPQYPQGPSPAYPSQYPQGPSPAYPPQPPHYPNHQHPQQYYQYPQRPPHAYPQRPGQRPYRKTPQYSQYYQQQQERIQNVPPGNEYEYFTSEGGTNKLTFSSNLETSQYYQQNDYDQQNQYYDKYSDYNVANNNNYTDYNNFNNNFNNLQASGSRKKFSFPTEPPSSPAPSVIPLPSTSSSIPSIYSSHDSTGSYSHRDVRRGKTLAFPNGQTATKYPGNARPLGVSSPMVFPDRTGTGDLRLDLDESGGYKTVHFASETNGYRPTAGNIFRGQRDLLRFPAGRSVYDDTIRLQFRQEEDNGTISPEGEASTKNTMPTESDANT